MIIKTPTYLALAAACLTMTTTLPAARGQTVGGTYIVTNGPQTNPDDVSPYWSPRQNVIESRRYDSLLGTNRRFREARMQKECGPIGDPQLRSQCVASFGQAEPPAGALWR